MKTGGYIFANAGFAIFGNLPLPYTAIQVINSK
jgi:hypothetical protein